jgi:hypothetical protein
MNGFTMFYRREGEPSEAAFQEIRVGPLPISARPGIELPWRTSHVFRTTPQSNWEWVGTIVARPVGDNAYELPDGRRFVATDSGVQLV